MNHDQKGFEMIQQLNPQKFSFRCIKLRKKTETDQGVVLSFKGVSRNFSTKRSELLKKEQAKKCHF